MLRLTEKLDIELDHHPLKQREQLVNSVTRFVRNVMNARRGSVAIDPDFGLPETDMFGSIHDEDEQQRLLRFIELYICAMDKRVLSVHCEQASKKNVTDVIVFYMKLKLIKNTALTLKTNLLADSTYEVEIA